MLVNAGCRGMLRATNGRHSDVTIAPIPSPPHQGLVRALSKTSPEAVSAAGPPLVHLQMLAAVTEAWELRWCGRQMQPPSGMHGGPTWPSGDIELGPTVPNDANFGGIEAGWVQREAAAGTELAL